MLAPWHRHQYSDVTTLSLPERGGHSKSGDIDRDGRTDLSDIVYLIDYMHNGGPAPELNEAADVNGDGVTDITDIDYFINYLLRSGPSPIEK